MPTAFGSVDRSLKFRILSAFPIHLRVLYHPYFHFVPSRDHAVDYTQSRTIGIFEGCVFGNTTARCSLTAFDGVHTHCLH